MKREAVSSGNQPFRAVVVKDGAIIGYGPSRVILDRNPNAHAEPVALWDAQRKVGTKEMPGAVIYSTSRRAPHARMPLPLGMSSACTSGQMAQTAEDHGASGRRGMPNRRLALTALTIGLLALGPRHMAVSQSPDRGRAMLEAAARGDIETLKRRIAAGDPLDPVNAAGETPLLLAVKNNLLPAALLLIDAGSNINAQAANKDSPWLLAGALGRTEMLRHMIPKGPDFSVRNRFGGNALIPACERAHVETVKLLLTTKIDVNHVNNLGWTCLLEIVILGDGGPRHVEVAKLVLDASADPNIADKDGVSPLAHARQKGQREIARLIEAAGGR
jgi:uncharacterized protein